MLRTSQIPATISHGGMRSDPRQPIGVSCVAPRTMVVHTSVLGSMPLRRAPSPVASSTAAQAALNASQFYLADVRNGGQRHLFVAVVEALGITRVRAFLPDARRVIWSVHVPASSA